MILPNQRKGYASALGIRTMRPTLKNWPGSGALLRGRPNGGRRTKDHVASLSYQSALRTTAVKVSSVRVAWHLLRIAARAGYFWVGVLGRRLWYSLRFWSSVTLSKLSATPVLEQQELNEERLKLDAVRFRKLLEGLGGVMIKVGQQLAQRVDLLPPAYCDELKEMVDVVTAEIDEADVKAAIKRQTKKSWDETFREFDFKNPVGSASVGCVYRASLHTGELVAVKIRRPNIQKRFAAAIEALIFILRAAEFLTIVRPQLTEDFRNELRESLLEELDFRLEARYQELFRRYHERRKKLHVTAPKVFYEPSGEEVLVSEYVTGRKAQAIIDAIRLGDEEYLEDLRRDGIDPKIVAKRLVQSRYYSFHECPLFHGDPHPGNVLVKPNNRIVMIDFGACGVFSERERNLMWQLNYCYSREDVGGMVNMVIAIMEPVKPPVRKWDQFRKELLDIWWKGFYGIKSKHSEEWERSSFRLWLGFFQLMRKHQIAVPRNMVRMIRATLLYDTVAASLYNKINVFKEFQKYSDGVARRAHLQIRESAIRQLLMGPDDKTVFKLRQIADVGNGLLFRLQKFLDDPEFSFAALAGKVYSAIRSFVRAFLLAGAAGLGALLIAVAFHRDHLGVARHPGKIWDSLTSSPLVLKHPSEWQLTPTSGEGFLQLISMGWLILVLLLVVTYGRRVYLRFGDVDD
ncbi:MAG: ubiquinone biosynthesis protein [Blastocatellia bacterium]|nr:ubiquinone biosynthesis protein [Blastocatellia bacterium]